MLPGRVPFYPLAELLISELIRKKKKKKKAVEESRQKEKQGIWVNFQTE